MGEFGASGDINPKPQGSSATQLMAALSPWDFSGRKAINPLVIVPDVNPSMPCFKTPKF
jgi:hypothetical protein